jgi:hypothetical protein
MRITSDGRVGIGTTNPGSNLQVQGLITGTAVTQSQTDATSNRLMKVGDFGLGGFNPGVIDANSILPAGFYSGPGSTGVNYPTGGQFHSFIASRRPSNSNIQDNLHFAGNSIFYRYTFDSGANWVTRQIYTQSNILGTVSQSDGIPTGAIIERGSNANGEFVKYADGTQICTLNITVTDQTIDSAYGASLFTGTRTWTYPAVFNAAPAVAAPGFRWGTSASWGAVGAAPTTTQVLLRGIDISSRATGTSVVITAIAIGRWY